MCRRTVLNCLHCVVLLTAAADPMVATVVAAVGFLGHVARTDWELGEDPGLSRQNIHLLDAFSNRGLLSNAARCLFR